MSHGADFAARCGRGGLGLALLRVHSTPELKSTRFGFIYLRYEDERNWAPTHVSQRGSKWGQDVTRLAKHLTPDFQRRHILRKQHLRVVWNFSGNLSNGILDVVARHQRKIASAWRRHGPERKPKIQQMVYDIQTEWTKTRCENMENWLGCSNWPSLLTF